MYFIYYIHNHDIFYLSLNAKKFVEKNRRGEWKKEKAAINILNAIPRMKKSSIPKSIQKKLKIGNTENENEIISEILPKTKKKDLPAYSSYEQDMDNFFQKEIISSDSSQNDTEEYSISPESSLEMDNYDSVDTQDNYDSAAMKNNLSGNEYNDECIDSDNTIRIVKDFIHLKKEAKHRKKILCESLSVEDKKISDILHYLENKEDISEEESIEIIKYLQQIRKQRRKIKNTLVIMTALVEEIPQGTMRIESAVNAVENHTNYTPKVFSQFPWVKETSHN